MAKCEWYGFSQALNREFVEGFENSSFTRPSGGVFEVKLAQNMKNEKGVCGTLLEFQKKKRDDSPPSPSIAIAFARSFQSMVPYSSIT